MNSSQRVLFPLPYDVVLHNVFPYLNVQDLGRLAQCNKTYYEYLLRDEAWEHIKIRCIDAVPFWKKYVFDLFPWKHDVYDAESVRKKAKLRPSACKSWKTPKGGTWYVLKTYIAKAKTVQTIRKILGPLDIWDKLLWKKQLQVNRLDIAYTNQSKFRFDRDTAKIAVACSVAIFFYPESECIVYCDEHSQMRINCPGNARIAVVPKRSFYIVNGREDCGGTPGFSRLFWF